MNDDKKYTEADCDTRFVVGVTFGLIVEWLSPDHSTAAIVGHVVFNAVFVSLGLWGLRVLNRRRAANADA